VIATTPDDQASLFALETLDSAIVAEYPTFGVPADQIVSDPQLAAAFWKAVQQRLPASGDVDLAIKNNRLLYLRRRGEDRDAFLDEMNESDCELREQLEVRSDGAFVVRGHRVSVQLLLQASSDGLTVAAIHERYPTIAKDVIANLVRFATEKPAAVARWLLVENNDAERHCTEANRGPSLEELRSRLAARTAG